MINLTCADYIRLVFQLAENWLSFSCVRQRTQRVEEGWEHTLTETDRLWWVWWRSQEQCLLFHHHCCPPEDIRGLRGAEDTPWPKPISFSVWRRSEDQLFHVGCFSFVKSFVDDFRRDFDSHRITLPVFEGWGGTRTPSSVVSATGHRVEGKWGHSSRSSASAPYFNYVTQQLGGESFHP